MPNWYPEYWVCLNPKRCNAVHWYKPTKCVRCGFDLLGRRDKVEQELRLEIDELRLDKELKIQAKMVRHWSEVVAERQAQYDSSKAALEITDAEISQSVRKNPESFGIEKVNNDAVKEAVLTHPDHKIAQKKVIKARYELDVAKAAVSGLQDKKRALSLLTELFIRDYYSEHSLEPKTDTEKEYQKDRVRNSARRRQREQEDDPSDD